MKILISNTKDYHENNILLGIAQVLTACQHDVILWDTDKKSAFDAFDEFEPDIFFTQLEMLNTAMVKCVTERPALRVVSKIFPYKFATEQHKEMIRNLACCDQPELSHTSNGYDELFDEWANECIDVIHIMNAANIFTSVGGVHKPEFKSELLLMQDKYSYTEPLIKEYFNQFLDVGFQHTVKTFGHGDWVGEHYCGSIHEQHHKNIYASSDVCMHLNHSDDISQNLFDLLSTGTFCIANHRDVLAKILPDELVLVKSAKEMKEMVDHYLRYPQEKASFISRAYVNVIKHHTYFNRVKEIFANLEIDNEAVIHKTFEEIKQQLYIEGIE